MLRNFHGFSTTIRVHLQCKAITKTSCTSAKIIMLIKDDIDANIKDIYLVRTIILNCLNQKPLVDFEESNYDTEIPTIQVYSTFLFRYIFPEHLCQTQRGQTQMPTIPHIYHSKQPRFYRSRSDKPRWSQC